MLAGCGQSSTSSDETGDKTEPIEPEQLPNSLINGDYKRIYNQTSAEFQKQVSLKQLENLSNDFLSDGDSFNLQSKLLIQEVDRYAWVNEDTTKGIIGAFDGNNTIVGLQLLPLESYPDTDNTLTKTTFSLPFEDEWYVFWGGTNTLVNYHYVYANQRYAYDFIIIEENSSYSGDQEENESYFAFGKNVIAPANGTIVEVENNIKDNEPVGEMNAEQPAGNYVIIDHGNDEYSLLAHFKHESIVVEEGDKVSKGDLLGLVGNSGNSSEPHIHFHVADAPDLENSNAIRINFDRDEDIIQGDTIQN